MIQLKKTILTLVALLAVTTGAWADGIVCTASDLGKVLCTDGSIYENVSAATTASKTAVAMIAYVDETNKNGLALALTDEDAMTWDNSAPSNKGKTAPELCSALNTSKAVTGGTWKLPSQDEWKQMFSANGGNEGSYTGLNNALAAAGGEGSKLLEGDEYWSSSEFYDDAWLLYLDDGDANWDTYGKHYQRGVRACLAFDIAASTGPEVAWDKAKKTGMFTMPGGNVTVSVEYYDLATLADKGLTAAEDAAAKTEAPLAVLAENAVTGGTLMYYVATDENFSQADAIALSEDEWSAAIPTAEELNPAGGTYYVWYYIKGDDEHSDTDPQRLAVTVLPEPTYNVEFAEGTNNAPNKWTATPNPAKKGQQVTVTYEGPRKVMGVKAEKKAEAKTLAEATLEDIGKIAGKDGKIYATKADAEAVATGNAVAMIAYVGTASDCAHGLAIALKDVSNEQLTWNNSGNNNESKTAAEWCSAWNTSKAVTGGTWRLPSISDWQYMFIGCGASELYSDNPIQMSYSGLASKLTTAQGDALPVNDDYWSSTVASPSYPWTVLFGDSYAFFGNNTWEGHAFDLVRACLAF